MKKIDDKTFIDEITICKQQSLEKNGRCNWGECEKCGVVPLLTKLNQSKLLEDSEEIRKIKKAYGVIE